MSRNILVVVDATLTQHEFLYKHLVFDLKCHVSHPMVYDIRCDDWEYANVLHALGNEFGLGKNGNRWKEKGIIFLKKLINFFVKPMRFEYIESRQPETEFNKGRHCIILGVRRDKYAR